MARIKGKWVGQVQLDFWYDDDEPYMKENFDNIKKMVTEQYSRLIQDCIYEGMGGPDCNLTVTVTQLHADLYRDEPSEWTKEEATP